MNNSLQRLSIIDISAFRKDKGGDMTSGLNLFENAGTAMSALGEQIDSLIGKIRDEICVSRPEQLLFQIAELSWMNRTQVSDDTIMYGSISEYYYPVEYIQSLLMVEQLHEPREVSAEELSRIGYTVLKDVQDLFILALRYEVAWAAQLSNVFGEELSKPSSCIRCGGRDIRRCKNSTMSRCYCLMMRNSKRCSAYLPWNLSKV